MFPEEYPEGFGELYDVEADPWEMNNLFFDPAHVDVVRDLHQELTDWLITTTRPATLLPFVDTVTPQASLHYMNAVNADGKIHPDHVRAMRRRNYI